MKLKKLSQAASAIALISITTTANADLITFDFTGRLIVAAGNGEILANNGQLFSPINASFTYDTVTGIGGSALSITMNGADFFNAPPTFHDITMNRIAGTNLIDGNVLVDWNGTDNMNLHVEWDATGLVNAIGFGLQVGDVISGTNLSRNGTFLADVNSATPYSDALQLLAVNQFQNHLYNEQGPAPLAATSGSLGLGIDTPFPGIRGYFDIGSGNSLHVTSVQASVVPVPAAVWLFGTGLLALVGVARRKA